jgi:hypothetical protein
MDDDQAASARFQNGMRDARTHVNRQKGRYGIEVPRTVAEQLVEVTSVIDGRRRRDPAKAAAAQHVRRDSGVGGAWLDLSQRAQGDQARLGERAFFEKLPDRHAERAERRRDERSR